MAKRRYKTESLILITCGFGFPLDFLVFVIAWAVKPWPFAVLIAMFAVLDFFRHTIISRRGGVIITDSEVQVQGHFQKKKYPLELVDYFELESPPLRHGSIILKDGSKRKISFIASAEPRVRKKAAERAQALIVEMNDDLVQRQHALRNLSA